MISPTRGFLNSGISSGATPRRIAPPTGSVAAILSTDADHPAQRLAALGGKSLATRELLTLLLDPGRGYSRAFLAASRLVEAFAGDGATPLRTIAQQPASVLATAAGIGVHAAARLIAALELGRRVHEETRGARDRISAPRDVYERMRPLMRDLVQEEFHVLLLNTQNFVLRDVTITRGTLDASLVHAREVFRPAVAESAAAIILVHNHPSGEPTPSPEDRSVTAQLVEAGELIGIPILDHIVVGENVYVSFVENGLMDSMRSTRE